MHMAAHQLLLGHPTPTCRISPRTHPLTLAGTHTRGTHPEHWPRPAQPCALPAAHQLLRECAKDARADDTRAHVALHITLGTGQPQRCHTIVVPYRVSHAWTCTDQSPRPGRQA